jgi:uncharacterized protein YraI
MSFKSVILAGALTLAGVGAANAAIVQSDLNLRSGPGTGYRVIATMPAGANVPVLGCAGSWCRVAFGGVEGYASANYLAGGAPVYAAEPVYVAPPVLGYELGVGPSWRRGWGYDGWEWHGHRRWHHRRHR